MVAAGCEQWGGPLPCGLPKASSQDWQSRREKDIREVTSRIVPGCHLGHPLPRSVQSVLLEPRIEVCTRASGVRGPCRRKVPWDHPARRSRVGPCLAKLQELNRGQAV